MRKIRMIIVFLWLLPYFSEVFAQAPKVESLEAFFAGVPVLTGYDSSKKHIAENPLLGIDSVGKRGIYSSLKSGKNNHFPFPDSLPVKLLLSGSKSQNRQLPSFLPDTEGGILIEVVFRNDKAGKKAHGLVFTQLKRELRQYYSCKLNPIGEMEFTNGINEKFPDCTLIKGYEPDMEFYFVLLEYWGLKVADK